MRLAILPLAMMFSARIQSQHCNVAGQRMRAGHVVPCVRAAEGTPVCLCACCGSILSVCVADVFACGLTFITSVYVCQPRRCFVCTTTCRGLTNGPAGEFVIKVKFGEGIAGVVAATGQEGEQQLGSTAEILLSPDTGKLWCTQEDSAQRESRAEE
jgi:hypothetical protein